MVTNSYVSRNEGLFLGVLINMGMNPKPELDDYYSNDYVDYQPFFTDKFSKKRFKQFFWNLSCQSTLQWACRRNHDTFWESAESCTLFK